MATTPMQSPSLEGTSITASPAVSVIDAEPELDTAPETDEAASESSADEDAAETGPEAVEKELQELLAVMDSSYKIFSETVFKKIDEMREKISVLDQTTVQLVEGINDMVSQQEGCESPRSARQRKRRS